MSEIIDVVEAGIPGPTGDVTPEALDAMNTAIQAKEESEAARDLSQLYAGQAGQATDQQMTQVLNGETDFSSTISERIKDEAITKSSINGPSQLVSLDGSLISVASDSGMPRVTDVATRSLMSVSSVASAMWGDSKVWFTRIGQRVFVDGYLIRAEALSSGTALDLGYITGPYLPAHVYDNFDPNGSMYPGSVSLRATGIMDTGTITNSVALVLRVKASGYIDVLNKDLAQYRIVRVSGTYMAQDAYFSDALSFPEFSGTYFKNWLDTRDMEEGVNYDVTHRYGGDPRLATLAIHGGSGEAGSQEVAIELARLTGSSLYYLDMRDGFYAGLHMDSNGFDDPRAVPLVKAATRCISMHGAADQTDWGAGNFSYVGGADYDFRKAVIDKLVAGGFPCVDAAESIPQLAGTNAKNICNQGSNGGVQIEMSTTLRRALFVNNSYARTNRQRKSQVFHDYVGLLNDVSKEWL